VVAKKMKIPSHHEGTKDTKVSKKKTPNFVLFVPSWWKII